MDPTFSGFSEKGWTPGGLSNLGSGLPDLLHCLWGINLLPGTEFAGPPVQIRGLP